MSELVVILLVIAACAAFGLLHRKPEPVACSTASSCDRHEGCETCELAPDHAESVR